MFDAIAPSVLGAFGFFAPNINDVRKADPTLSNEELERDMKVGVLGAAGWSFLIVVAVAHSSGGTRAYAIWLALVAAIAGAYLYAYRYRG